jgi:hypothetical protein
LVTPASSYISALLRLQPPPHPFGLLFEIDFLDLKVGGGQRRADRLDAGRSAPDNERHGHRHHEQCDDREMTRARLRIRDTCKINTTLPCHSNAEREKAETLDDLGAEDVV